MKIDTRTLARLFSERLREHIGEDDFREMLRRNATEEYVNKCASHDFCDANIIMDDAMWAVLSDDPGITLDIVDPADRDAWTEAWEAAWELAQNMNFFVEDKRLESFYVNAVKSSKHLEQLVRVGICFSSSGKLSHREYCAITKAWKLRLDGFRAAN